jgi:hypothetical protein
VRASRTIPPQVADIDVTKETPVGHGRITCFSVYAGPELDFGNKQHRLWVDVLKGGPEVMNAFKPYLESEDILKVRNEASVDSAAHSAACCRGSAHRAKCCLHTGVAQLRV